MKPSIFIPDWLDKSRDADFNLFVISSVQLIPKDCGQTLFTQTRLMVNIFNVRNSIIFQTKTEEYFYIIHLSMKFLVGDIEYKGINCVETSFQICSTKIPLILIGYYINARNLHKCALKMHSLKDHFKIAYFQIKKRAKCYFFHPN